LRGVTGIGNNHQGVNTEQRLAIFPTNGIGHDRKNKGAQKKKGTEKKSLPAWWDAELNHLHQHRNWRKTTKRKKQWEERRHSGQHKKKDAIHTRITLQQQQICDENG